MICVKLLVNLCLNKLLAILKIYTAYIAVLARWLEIFLYFLISAL